MFSNFFSSQNALSSNKKNLHHEDYDETQPSSTISSSQTCITSGFTTHATGSDTQSSFSVLSEVLAIPDSPSSTLSIDTIPYQNDQATVCPFDERIHYTPQDNIEEFSSRQLSESDSVFSKNFAELSMVCRVLSMALDLTVPLLDRFKFLCIVSHYVDEYFAKTSVRRPLLDLTDFQSATINLFPQPTCKTGSEAHLATALKIIAEKQAECMTVDLLPKLGKEGAQVVPAEEMTGDEAVQMNGYFEQHLKPALTPFLLDPSHPFPLLQSHEIYLYVTLRDPRKDEMKKVILRTPSQRRLIPIDGTRLRFVTAEDLCLANAGKIFSSMTVLQSHAFRVTRNTKLDIGRRDLENVNNMVDFIVEEVHNRRQAPATRLEVVSSAPPEMVELLKKKLFLHNSDVYRVHTPFLDLSSCMALAFVPIPSLRSKTRNPVVPPPFKGLQAELIADPGSIFGAIRKKDVLIEYPRHDFRTSAVLFLHAAARDPQVQSIKTVLYRGGSDSPIIAALIRAAKNGKDVTVVIELKASFDEVQNSQYTHTLQVAGCNVTYGVLGLKVHSKVMLVVRQEKEGNLCSYANVSTGNFNPKTAKLYTDYSLFTCDKDICADVLDVFNKLTGYSDQANYRTLLVAPMNMRDRFIEMIRAEADNSRAGKPARITCQMNGLTDKDITYELYLASQAGVKIDLIVRGACRLRPGIPGVSENINVFSWVGPLLQHRRVYYFHAGGEGKYFIGSADWRTRNLSDRIEVVVPIKDPSICKKISKAFKLMDDAKFVWRLSRDGRYYKTLPSTSPQLVCTSTAPRLGSTEGLDSERSGFMHNTEALCSNNKPLRYMTPRSHRNMWSNRGLAEIGMLNDYRRPGVFEKVRNRYQ